MVILKNLGGRLILKILSINTLPNGSTGNIMNQILNKAKEKHEVISYYGNWYKKINCKYSFSFSFGFYWENKLSAIVSKITGSYKFISFFGTQKLLRKITDFKPDIIHLHNLHLWVINISMLFKYIKKYNIPVVWTLHDCWAFTGRCPHFVIEKCDKWKNGCHKCTYNKEFYPAAYVDRTKTMWELKKKWFTGVRNLTIVTPSQWLADLVKQSYLKDYPVKVINNGIDLSVFKPSESNCREKYHITEKYIVLGVAFDWGKRKGLDVFIDLANKLSKDYKIVLVGTDEKVDKQLPKNIVSIHRTQNQQELAEIYAAADVFANPTREENFPTVNIESLACGTPVVTFKTGGSPEIIDENCGSVVECDDNIGLMNEIIRICETKPFTEESCLRQANKFDMSDRFQEYVELYEKIEK